MGKPITYPDSGGSYTRKGDGKLDLVQATEQLRAVPETAAQEQPAVPPKTPAPPATTPAPLKPEQES